MKQPKNNLGILRIIKIILLGCLVLFTTMIIFVIKFQDRYVEQKFLKEMASVPEARGKIRNTFEGGTLADIQIPNKGSITIMYGLFGLEYIRRIGQFDTVFICPENRSVGIGFSLAKNSKFEKWFPFEVNSLQELVNHYDDIVAILDTFPHSPNPNYAVITSSRPFGGSDITCSIYFKK